MTIDDWRYAEHVPEARRRALSADGSFAALLRRVVDDASAGVVYGEPGRDPGLTDCVQPIIVLDLPTTGDALFNGPYGYRAQYWLAPETGLAANARLIAALAPKLLAAAAEADDPQLSRIDLSQLPQAMLLSTSAMGMT